MVETKAGAAGQVGAQVAASAKPDGYTLLSHNNGLCGYAEVDKLFGRQPKTTRADFIPLARLIADPVLLLVNDQQPYKTLKEFIDDVKKRPDAIIYSSGGLYGATHLPVAIVRTGGGRIEDAPSADQWRRPGDHGHPGQQRAGERANGVGDARSTSRPASCGRWRCSAASARRRCPTCRRLRSSATISNTICGSAFLRRRARRPTSSSTLDGAIDKAANADQFKTAIANLGQEPGYLNAADFAKFWEAEGKRTDDVVKAIGKQG